MLLIVKFYKDKSSNSGFLKLANANVKWFLTIDGKKYLPKIKEKIKLLTDQ